MTDYCIASPHKNELWYDYRLYDNLKSELKLLGFNYRAGAKNRIYLLGGRVLHFYPEVGPFDEAANNIALSYCHFDQVKDYGIFNHVFFCSQRVQSKIYVDKRCRLPAANIGIIRPFSSLTPSTTIDTKYSCDIAFIGTPRIRPIVEAILPIVEKHKLDFKLFGPNWDKYSGNNNAVKYWSGTSIPYKDISVLAHNAKLCLIDHHESMNQDGAVSHKYVDFLSAGSLVISDNNKNAKGFYKGLCFTSPDDLEPLVLKYLASKQLRTEQIALQLELLSKQTTALAARTLSEQFI
ncbi:hypothetical protein M0C34_07380 [Agarivorans sp. TSD2052]|uniref:glycosyltransferase family protein n=1 Tax=Agarivorans sp. TSD2052 TaxID=2937286 RepID=UPI00200D5344|nr:hypothetical protein [Agarivorans sp. TSD2052]UPW20076.1 hypothetical protein M0C34_07380 [Agarivorans sp. TSD2052]